MRQLCRVFNLPNFLTAAAFSALAALIAVSVLDDARNARKVAAPPPAVRGTMYCYPTGDFVFEPDEGK